jgi:hypothetical protein
MKRAPDTLKKPVAWMDSDHYKTQSSILLEDDQEMILRTNSSHLNQRRPA